jgi:hypothetical protein
VCTCVFCLCLCNTGSQLLVILLILILGFWKSDRSNLTPFLPYGVDG